MSVVYLDVTTSQLSHNRVLQSYVSVSELVRTAGAKYLRIDLRAFAEDTWKQLLVRATIEECIHWVLQERYRRLLRAESMDTVEFYKRIAERIPQIQPRLELFVCHDIDSFSKRQKDYAGRSWNIEGYLRFSAKKLKWAVETVLQEIYQFCKEEQEREAFIGLLQFCAVMQPSLLEEVFITLSSDAFTMVDLWGNDLQQIYLETLPKEEYEDVQMHDLLLSILMTMLPQTIHIFLASEALTLAEETEQQRLLQLLVQIFGDRIHLEVKE